MDAQAPEEETEDEEFDDEEVDGDDEDDLDDESIDEENDETESDPQTEDHNMEEGDEPAAADVLQESALDTEYLEVPIAFNLGHAMVSVADLRTLASGYVFDLENEPGAEVVIVAGEREIGRGEVVQIADRLGVRIISLRGGSHA